jgi:hypothetical protein
MRRHRREAIQRAAHDDAHEAGIAMFGCGESVARANERGAAGDGALPEKIATLERVHGQLLRALAPHELR